MLLPFYSAGPICEGVSCWPFALVYLLEYAWIAVGAVALLGALLRWVLIKKIDRISIVFGIVGLLILTYAFYKNNSYQHRFDADSRAAVQKLRSEVPWPTQLPDGWSARRVVAQVYGKEPQSAYVYAEFTDKDADKAPYTLHIFDTAYTQNTDFKCGYSDPSSASYQPYIKIKPDAGCEEFYTLPSNQKVHRKRVEQSERAYYYLRQDGLVVVLESSADDNAIKAFYVRLENTPAQELPFIAN